jgi:hypothetical protein
VFTLACAAFFLMVGKGVANALAFARFVTVAALPDYSDGQDLNAKVIKLIAVCIVSVVCLIHYFSTDLGRLLNKLTALYKLILLVVVFGSGFWVAARVQHVGLGREDDQPPVPGVTSRLGAFVLILYSYSGWENANYVSVHDDQRHQRRLTLDRLLERSLSRMIAVAKGKPYRLALTLRSQSLHVHTCLLLRLTSVYILRFVNSPETDTALSI